jgi:hypothetical protein
VGRDKDYFIMCLLKMNKLIIKIIIKYLLRKQGRETIPLGSPAALKNDDLYIHLIEKQNNKNFYNIESIIGNKILCFHQKDNIKCSIEIDFKDINKYQFSVSYFYKDWHIKYDNIYEVFFHILFGIIKIRRIKNNIYSKNIKNFTDRVKLIQILLDISRNNNKDFIDMNLLCDKLYGKRYMQYQHYPYIKDFFNLRFILLSLKHSGDVDFSNEFVIKDLKILPKALETLSNYEIDMSKHIDSFKITRWQLIVAIIMAILALSNLIISIINY